MQKSSECMESCSHNQILLVFIYVVINTQVPTQNKDPLPRSFFHDFTPPDETFVLFVKVMKKNKRERDEDSVRHGDQYDTQLLWFLMRHMRNRRPQRVSSPTAACGIEQIST